MADFWSQYKNDFPDLGGFKSVPTDPYNTGYNGGSTFDPRVTTQPQPYQQGPGGIQGPMGNLANGISAIAAMSPQERAQAKIQALQKAHPNGFFGNLLQTLGSPGFIQGLQGMADRQQAGMPAAGAVAGQVGNWMQGGNLSSMGPIQQQMNQNGGFYAPPAMQMGPNGPQETPGQPQQPMNPGQQSGQVQMQAPDGTMQYVNQEHVPHYQSLGAQVYNGSSYGGQ